LQGHGLDQYADARSLAAYRAQDEKHDWSAIPVQNLNRCHSSLSFFDAEGMRFHLPAYLIAELEGSLNMGVVFHLTYVGDGHLSRFDMLSDSLRDAVRQSLLLHMSDVFDRPLVEMALAEYWAAPMG
jgi:hypothetical protein